MYIYIYIYILRIWTTSLHCAGQSLTNTVRTNKIHKHYKFVFYFTLHVSATHIDHPKMEYRYRRKSATEEVFLSVEAFLSVPVFHLSDIQYFLFNNTFKYQLCLRNVVLNVRCCLIKDLCKLYVFFWVIPRRLNFICRRFGTLCLFHLHRQVDVE